MLLVILACISSTGVAQGATPLLINGNFTDNLSGWTNNSIYIGGAPYSGGVSIVNDGANSNVAKLSGMSGSNYYLILEQDINVINTSYSNFDISFDWRVTQIASTYGVNYIIFDFLDKDNFLIGRAIYFDTSDAAHTLDYMRNVSGQLTQQQYIGYRLYNQIFDWQHIAINTSSMTSMDNSRIAKISVQLNIQNNAGAGGEMLLDNVTITGNDPIPIKISVPVMEGWWLIPGALAGLGVFARRRKN